MIPARFDYERPATLDEALRVLATSDGLTRAIAGGQSLLPLMKLRLARPDRLVDIGRLSELRGVRRLNDGRLAIGALATWSELLEESDVMALGLLADAIPTIGDVAVRNRGTIGGSLAHADPAADIAAPLLALDAELTVRSATGERSLAIGGLYLGPFATALEPGELITEVRIPAVRETVGSAYVAVTHPASGYPVAGAAAVLVYGGDGRLDACAVAITGVGEHPYRATEVENALLNSAAPGDAVTEVGAGQRVLADPYADREYRAAMAGVVARRAIEAALRRAGVAPPPGSAAT